MLTLMPAPVSSWMTGIPSGVAGTFTIRLGRSTAAHSRRASAAVAALSWASSGETSMLTNPSAPALSSKTGRRMSAAARMSAMASAS